MDFTKFIDNKEILEVYTYGSDKFDVGRILHFNGYSVFLECYGKEGNFCYYMLLPRDSISAIQYKTGYIKDLGISDKISDDEFDLSGLGGIYDALVFLKENHIYVIVDDGEDYEVACGYIEEVTDDLDVVIKICESGVDDGYCMINFCDDYSVRWGGNTEDRK